MGKRIKRITLERQSGWYKNHRDSFENPDRIYEPYWRVEDIPSFGVKTKIPHFKTRHRIVHLLSQNELWMYLQLAHSPLVIEIYEQYAIPLEFSIPIARTLGVEHPVDAVTRVPLIQTIDFYCEVLDPETGEIKNVAYPVKQDSDALRVRTAEKLALQEAFCELEHADYQLTTSKLLRTTYSYNLELLYRYRNLPFFLVSLAQRWLMNFLGLLSDDVHCRTAHLIKRASLASGIPYLDGVAIFYYLLWHRALTMNWSRLLTLELAASELGIRAHD
ncbi:TnsA endonuclease N-terminal domain-containing protein [Shewanella mangrovisoli]|uniref:TnsA endonuclease N-terminal domain-containing protein n=1 Tax=Shewanella mangrovisoli TaxID=2864211 RepID=UPI0035B7CDCA